MVDQAHIIGIDVYNII